MKRNNDLIRAVLDYIETKAAGHNALSLSERDFSKEFPDLSQDILNEHIELLVQKGFLKAEPHQFGWFITSLTWEGYDFLANAKDQTIWDKTKQLAGHLSFDVFATVIQDVALKEVGSRV